MIELCLFSVHFVGDLVSLGLNTGTGIVQASKKRYKSKLGVSVLRTSCRLLDIVVTPELPVQLVIPESTL